MHDNSGILTRVYEFILDDQILRLKNHLVVIGCLHIFIDSHKYIAVEVLSYVTQISIVWVVLAYLEPRFIIEYVDLEHGDHTV